MAQETSNHISQLEAAGLSTDDASKLAAEIDSIQSGDYSCSEQWRRISKHLLTPQTPFAVHQYLFNETYVAKTFAASREPDFIWIPTHQEIQETNLYDYMLSQNKELSI